MFISSQQETRSKKQEDFIIKMMKVTSRVGALVALVVILISSAPTCRSILVGGGDSPKNSSENLNEQRQEQQGTNDSESKTPHACVSCSNLTIASDNQQHQSGAAPKELDASSTFYYDADAYLLNKKSDKSAIGAKQEPGKLNGDDDDNNNNNNNSKRASKRPADLRAISGRNGRMLDLDALVGDFATSKANREARSQLTSRQSRNLGQQQHLDIGGGKRLHIQGFIPIVGVKDADSEESESGQESQSEPMISSVKQQRPKMLTSSSQVMGPFLQQQQSQQQPGLDLPYGQSSIGHATFNVQRYLNTDQATGESIGQHQFVQLPQLHSHQQQLIDSKTSSGSAGGLVNSLTKPIKKLASSFGGGGGSDNNQMKQQQHQQGSCLCVPFYMCKSGYLSESGLGRAQIQQMIVQQQQQQQQAASSGQQPRQLIVEQSSVTKPGIVESVASGSNNAAASYANSIVPVDERSFERDIITVAPTSLATLDSYQSSNQTLSASENQQQQQQQSLESGAANTSAAKQENSPAENGASSDQGPSSSAFANASSNAIVANHNNPDEMTTLDQAGSDYSQDILGRMLGLKSVGQQAANQQQPSSAGGVCGLLRTCCNIPQNLLPFQQQQMQVQVQQQQVALQRYQQQPFASLQSQLQQPQQSPVAQQISRMQYGALAPPVTGIVQQQLSSNSLTHRTSPLQSSFGMPRPQAVSPMTPHQMSPVQQYARATYPQQPLQSFQQQQQPQAVALPYNSIQRQSQQQLQPMQQVQQGVVPQVARQSQLGTRKLLEGRCGLRQSTGINGRVQNLAYQENAAEFGEYPAQAAILKRLNGSESLFVCGGALISQSWVATAAHCIRKHMQQVGSGGEQHLAAPLTLKVRLGEWDVHRDDEFYPYVEKEVRDLVVHPDFVPGNLINDLALLRLDSPVDPTLPHINPACLPTIDESFARQRCWVTGWGKDSFGSKGSFQAVLQEVELPVLGHAECEHNLRQTRLGPHYRLHAGFICAGGEGGKDACEGDGGSGLYCADPKDGGTLKVAGLVSWGIGCGQAGVPGVYVSMAQYRPWIENIISIDEDIYSSYNQLPSTLISERSNGGAGVAHLQLGNASTTLGLSDATASSAAPTTLAHNHE